MVKTKTNVKVEKKKVFLLINSLEMGGAERVVSNISTLLDEKYDVEILTLKRANQFYNLDVRVNSLTPAKSNFCMLMALPIAICKLNRLIKKNPGVKVISFLELSNFVNILANKKAIISLRIHTDVFRGFFGTLYKFGIKTLYPRATRLIVNSEQNALAIAEFAKMPANKIQVIHNPMPLKEKIEAAKKKHVDLPNAQKKHKFVVACRLEAHKNVFSLVDAFIDFAQTDSQAVLYVIGDGPQKTALSELIKSRNATNCVHLLGAQKDVLSYHTKMSAFIYSSTVEGMPNALLEAVACGLPIITTDFPTGAREIIDPKMPLVGKIIYPYSGPNGILISRADLKTQLPKACGKILHAKQHMRGVDRFESSNVKKSWVDLVENDLLEHKIRGDK